MDKSKEYIKMCEGAHVIQHEKYLAGFEEGDFVYTGSDVRVVGHDFINMVNFCTKHKKTTFDFLMFEPDGCNISYESPTPETIDTRIGIYQVSTISHPVWLPRTDQLLRIVRMGSLGQSKVRESVITVLQSVFVHVTLEPPLLEVIMYYFYGYEWNHKNGWCVSDAI